MNFFNKYNEKRGNLRQKILVSFLFLYTLFFLVSAILPGDSFAQTAPGEKTINMSLSDTPVTQIISIIGETFGVSVVPSKSITGNITISLTGSTLEQAMTSLTQPNGWEWYRKENTVYIVTSAEFIAIQAKDVITKWFPITNTNAQDVQTVIQPMLSTVGKIIRDDRTNMLQVSDTPESLARIEQIIMTLDIPIEVEVFALKYAVASDVKTQIDKVKTVKGDIQVDDRTNTLIITDVPSAIEKMRKVIENLDIQTQLEVFDIHYAKPKDIVTAVKEILTKRGYIQVDERNSKIIIDDIPSHLEKIAKVIKALDEPDRMVFIEAEIVDMDYQKQLDLGINWSYGATWALSNASSNNVSIPIYSGSWFNSIKSFFTNYTSTLSLNATASAKALSSLLGNTEVLASPRLMAKNDEKAKIHVGGTLPYTTLQTQPSSGSTGSYQYYSQASQPFGIDMTVTPHINSDGVIDMKVDVSNSDASAVSLDAGNGTTFSGVKTTESSAQTMIQVKNNQTVIIGGLVSRSKTESGTGIPVLENIPLVGPILFGSRSKNNQKRNLIVFITPHIVTGTRADAERVFPEAFKTYSEVTSEESDKDRKKRLEREAKEKAMKKNAQPILPGISTDTMTPIIPNNAILIPPSNSGPAVPNNSNLPDMMRPGAPFAPAPEAPAPAKQESDITPPVMPDK